MAWLLDNLIALIALAGSMLGLLISYVKMSEHIKQSLQVQSDDISTLRRELEEEKERNRENYNKQDRKLEDAINRLESRLDKIDEMNQSINDVQKEIATIKTDISYIKDDVKEVKQDVKTNKK